MKELKEFNSTAKDAIESDWWNPVKELKVFAIVVIGFALEIIVESGEGIESTEFIAGPMS